MDKIYLLIKSYGDCDHYMERIMGYYTDKEKLEAYAQKLQDHMEYVKSNIPYIEDTGVEEPDTDSDEAWDEYDRVHNAEIYQRCKSLNIDPDIYDMVARYDEIGYAIREVAQYKY